MAESIASNSLIDHPAFDRIVRERLPDVENAIYVSWLENVFLGDERPEFLASIARLPARLAEGLRELEKHFESLGRVRGPS